MRILACIAALCGAALSPLLAQNPDAARWERQARNVTITRDDWGIPHIRGHTDADAVFGLLYAQAEDDFNRIEANYLEAMGRLAEAEGESRIWQDLRMKLIVNPDSMKALYASSPAWLKQLMNAFADGLNFYLYRNPGVHPRVITHFEPWMALAFSEGSIGPDIERVNLAQLQAFYGAPGSPTPAGSGSSESHEPTGSNGIAIAPSNTVARHALFLINPHTSFFFRAEVQVTSDEGLNAYGAVTWGQFFIYQGFNERLGWMHSSSGVDNIDEYIETVRQQGGHWLYRYGSEDRPLGESRIAVPYRTAAGMATRTFTVYRTLHGPVIRKTDDRWVTIRLMQNPLNALIESYSRTKARNYQEFLRTVNMQTNSSNNTVYADADGNIAYFQATFIPRRDTSFDWTKPVDGSNPATDWHSLLPVSETPHLLNPASGWLYNSNNSPWSAAGPDSPRKADYPAYVESGIESARGRHAIRVLSNTRDFTIGSLLGAAFDSYLPWFETTLPMLLRAWEQLPAGDAMKAKLQGPIDSLRGWDLRWGVGSVPTSVAVFWGDRMLHTVNRDARAAGMPTEDWIAAHATPATLLGALAAATDSLTSDFGTWRTPWGDINRFQRLNDDIAPTFSDSGASIPVGFTSSTWGSLASFGARAYPGTKKWYGTSGNSFVAAVEFGDSVRARAVTAGGESGHPGTPHFNDEAGRYATGNLRDVYFYRSQLRGHTEREYHPGS